jgi:hypothetical protein
MSDETCGCERFERLEGAAAHAYAVRFLERTDSDRDRTTIYFRCRVCARDWKRVEQPGLRRASLIRLDREENV